MRAPKTHKEYRNREYKLQSSKRYTFWEQKRKENKKICSTKLDKKWGEGIADIIVGFILKYISIYEWIKNKDIHVYEYKRINDDLESIYVKIFGLSSAANKEDDA